MRFPSIHRPSPIGLDLGSHSLKAAQLTKSKTGWKLAHAVSLPRVSAETPVSTADLVRFKDVLHRRGFAGRDVVVSVPSSILLTSILELPARAPGVPLEQIAGVEFARAHNQEPGAMTMTTWDLPAPARGSKATYVMAVGAVSGALEQHLDLIESAGFHVVAVDDPASAAVRAGALVTDPAALTAVVDFGWSSVNLIVVKQGLILYVRRLNDSGLGVLRAECVKALEGNGDLFDVGIRNPKLGIPEGAEEDALTEIDDALASHLAEMCREIAQAVGYVSHQYPNTSSTSLVLTGGGAIATGIAGRMQAILGFETRLGVSTVDSTCLPETESNLPLLVNSAMGLAKFAEVAA